MISQPIPLKSFQYKLSFLNRETLPVLTGDPMEQPVCTFFCRVVRWTTAQPASHSGFIHCVEYNFSSFDDTDDFFYEWNKNIPQTLLEITGISIQFMISGPKQVTYQTRTKNHSNTALNINTLLERFSDVQSKTPCVKKEDDQLFIS